MLNKKYVRCSRYCSVGYVTRIIRFSYALQIIYCLNAISFHDMHVQDFYLKHTIIYVHGCVVFYRRSGIEN